MIYTDPPYLNPLADLGRAWRGLAPAFKRASAAVGRFRVAAAGWKPAGLDLAIGPTRTVVSSLRVPEHLLGKADHNRATAEATLQLGRQLVADREAEIERRLRGRPIHVPDDPVFLRAPNDPGRPTLPGMFRRQTATTGATGVPVREPCPACGAAVHNDDHDGCCLAPCLERARAEEW